MPAFKKCTTSQTTKPTVGGNLKSQRSRRNSNSSLTTPAKGVNLKKSSNLLESKSPRVDRSPSPCVQNRPTSTPIVARKTNSVATSNNNQTKKLQNLHPPPFRLLTRQKPIELPSALTATTTLKITEKASSEFKSKTPPVQKKSTLQSGTTSSNQKLSKPKSLSDLRSSSHRSSGNSKKKTTVVTPVIKPKNTKSIVKKFEKISNNQQNDKNNNNQLKIIENNTSNRAADNVILRCEPKKKLQQLNSNDLSSHRHSIGATIEEEQADLKTNINLKRRSLEASPPTVIVSQASAPVRKETNLNRGQGPSGSKNQQIDNNRQQHHNSTNNLKTSNSVSSLDGIDGTTKSSSKTSKLTQKFHGSNDKLQSNHHFKTSSKDKLDSRNGSKERIVDCFDAQQQQQQQLQQQHQHQSPPAPPIKYKKKQPSPMPIIQQNVIANNNLLDQRDVIGEYNERSVDLITIDPTREATLQQQQSMMQELQNHLERLTREKMALEAKVSELSAYQNEVQHLRNEIVKFQNLHEKNCMEIQKLTDENEMLRNRLRDVVKSPLSDAEKHQLIQDSQRLHSSAPASIALPNNREVDGTPCVTPDWDKNSSSSEISVACLQDKIIQMEETHYSTNEELQATLQELADLQTQLTELQTDNERLAEEKDVLFQSLCRQTEKLEDSRNQIGTLQELLLRESNAIESNTTEREQKLLDLLKNAQEERESLFIKQEELNSDLNELRSSLEKQTNENARLRERICLLDSTVDAATAERKQIESQLAQTKEESAEKQIEISRLSTLLDNARAKIDELEQDRAMGDKTDLGELLDAARREKDLLEAQVASLQEQLSKCQCEIQKLKDQLAGITEECKVARNNAKCALSDLEYKYENLKEEKDQLCKDYQNLQDSANELQVQCKCHIEDKAQLESLLSETQRHLGEAERLLAEKEERIQEEIRKREEEAEEWKQFQSDLLISVRVANDFKTEAQIAQERLVMDNKTLREKLRAMEQQIEKLNKQVSTSVEQAAQQSLLTTVQQEMAARRQKVGISRQDSRLSVKSLIESIENVNKQTKSSNNLTTVTVTTDSKCSSTSSINSIPTEAHNGGNNISGTVTLGNNTTIVNQNGGIRTSDWSDNIHAPVVGGMTAKSPLREQQQTAGTNINITLNGGQKSIISGERKDPLNALVKNGGSKRNALLKWCQNKTVGYRNIDITNFSSSWNDGLAFCAILHSYLPDKIPYDSLGPNNKRRNFSLAFTAAESVGIPTTLNINEMCQQERPDWTQVMAYVTAIYKHFEA